jgi:hypothetical protein
MVEANAAPEAAAGTHEQAAAGSAALAGDGGGPSTAPPVPGAAAAAASSVRCFSEATPSDGRLDFQVIDLGRQLYVWVAVGGARMGNLAFAIQPPGGGPPSAAVLTRGGGGASGEALARRLGAGPWLAGGCAGQTLEGTQEAARRSCAARCPGPDAPLPPPTPAPRRRRSDAPEAPGPVFLQHPAGRRPAAGAPPQRRRRRRWGAARGPPARPPCGPLSAPARCDSAPLGNPALVGHAPRLPSTVPEHRPSMPARRPRQVVAERRLLRELLAPGAAAADAAVAQANGVDVPPQPAAQRGL